MAKPLKHVGFITNTQKRCIVVFMRIPGAADYALVVDSDALPPRFHDPIMDILMSDEGQQDHVFGTTLSRRIMPDTGKPVLDTLHESGLLMKVPVKQVMMVPVPNARVPLEQVLQAMDMQAGTTIHDPNFFQEQVAAQTNEDKIITAQNHIMQAELLEQDAREYRRKAYELAPQLRPQTMANIPPAPTPPIVEVDPPEEG